MAGENSNQHNYTSPGQQQIFPVDLMKGVYFMSEEEWNKDRKHGNFDYVVVGSSFCALGFTQRMLEKNPEAKILIIERGDYFYPEHFQNLPPSYTRALVNKSETFPWRITEKTLNGKNIKWQHGVSNVFGGRSLFWRGWCPKPDREEMEGWPESVKEKVEEYFPEATRLLNVIAADQIGTSRESSYNKDDQCIFGELQKVLVEKLKSCPLEIIRKVDHASLSVRTNMSRYEDIRKYSATGPLLNLLLIKKYCTEKGKQQPLKIMTGCLVEKVDQECGKALALKTSKGDFTLADAKLILAMGTLPPTTLMLNSFPSSLFKQLAGIGTRFTAHFMSCIIARVPVPEHVDSDNMYFNFLDKIRGKLEVAAVYIAGQNPDSKHHFHIQMSAFIDETSLDIHDVMRHLPDVVATPTMEQMRSSKVTPYIVIACASIGQLDHVNEDNWFRLNSDEDMTCNATLQVVANNVDNNLWDTMDDSTFTVLEMLESQSNQLGLDNPRQLEYWHSTTHRWEKKRPPTNKIRTPGLVHEASTMWIGDKEPSPVDLDYRFRGIDNMYLTGGALWPTAASFNPTCTMTALAMDLADKLNNKNMNNNNNSI